MSYEQDAKAWKVIQDKEFIKLLIADLRRIRNDIEIRTTNYNPLNPDESLDDIYQLSKQMERDLDTLYSLYLDEWTEAVKEARHGQDFEGEEADDLELYRSIIQTRQMGDSASRGEEWGRWRKRRNRH